MIYYGQCISSNITVPFIKYEISKANFGIGIVVVDIVFILSFYFFLDTIQTRAQEFIDEFRTQTVKMSDFTIRVKNLPPDMTYGDNELILRAYLWEHFRKVLHLEKLKKSK
jgi:hypothetical protein